MPCSRGRSPLGSFLTTSVSEVAPAFLTVVVPTWGAGPLYNANSLTGTPSSVSRTAAALSNAFEKASQLSRHFSRERVKDRRNGLLLEGEMCNKNGLEAEVVYGESSRRSIMGRTRCSDLIAYGSPIALR